MIESQSAEISFLDLKSLEKIEKDLCIVDIDAAREAAVEFGMVEKDEDPTWFLVSYYK